MTVASPAEASITAHIGATLTAGLVPSVSAPTSEAAVEKFPFDAEYQARVAAFLVRDIMFARHAAHLLKPEYFEDVGVATLVDIGLRHIEKYRECPDFLTLTAIIKDRIKAGTLRKDVAAEVVKAVTSLRKAELVNRDDLEQRVAEFARNQAVSAAILKSVDMIPKGKWTEINDMIRKAVEIGLNEEGTAYDYYAQIEARTEKRKEIATGSRTPNGVTTGNIRLDELLYHKGWGLKELSVIMGGAKKGKTTALINFAKSASIAGKNVLYVTLEVASDIIADRTDASISGHLIKEIAEGLHLHDVKGKVEAVGSKAGKLLFNEFPSGSMTPNMLRKLLDKYKRDGITFDLVVVDYADIMAPNQRTNDAIENSKSVYVDLRAISFEYNVAMLTATQTNRDGYKSVVAKAEHVSEDFNKIRIADLVISINSTEEEVAAEEARLYFAASRNQASGFTVYVKQSLARMRFIESIMKVE